MFLTKSPDLLVGGGATRHLEYSSGSVILLEVVERFEVRSVFGGDFPVIFAVRVRSSILVLETRPSLLRLRESVDDTLYMRAYGARPGVEVVVCKKPLGDLKTVRSGKYTTDHGDSAY